MRKSNLLVFDDFMVGSVIGTGPVYTRQDLNAPLGAYDIVAVQIVVDKSSATPFILGVLQQHSADAQNWVDKTTILTLDTTIVSGPPWSTMGADATGVPSLAFVRFALSFTSGTPTARVRLYATLRDQGAGSSGLQAPVAPLG